MIIRNFYEHKLAQASYLIGCGATGQAIVVDPLRDISGYLEAAQRLSLKIVAVTETHIHADYLSGTRELAAATGATIYLSGEGGETWQYGFRNEPGVRLVRSGERIEIGNLWLDVLHVPGHTPEHLAFLLTDPPTSSIPHSLFSGDFVFIGDVGRPDLLERAAQIKGTMEAGARDLFRSLRKLSDLPDSLLIWPGHGAGSACGKSLGGSPVSSLGYERRTNWAFLVGDEDKFVEEILAGQPEPPRYFREMKRLNREGPAMLGALPRVARVPSVSGQVVDVRGEDEIRAGSFAGSVTVPYCNSFTGYAGWVVDYDRPLTLIAGSQVAADAAARDLAMIGIDDVAGWVSPRDLPAEGFSPVRTITPGEIEPGAVVLDVRGLNERNVNWVPGSLHVPYGQLASRIDEVPRERRIVVHCASGGRSLVAYSVLRNAGFNDLRELSGGIEAIERESPELLSRT